MFTSRLGTYAAALATAAVSAGAVLAMAPAAGAATTPVWSITATPSPAPNSVLDGVSCTSATACIAVGAANTAPGKVSAALAERWNGTAWAVLATPTVTNGVLYAVSCTSATACTAVGASYQTDTTLAEQWNGKTWAIQATPSPSGNGYLYGVSCTSATACTAVGTYAANTNPGLTLAERWNGTTWTVQRTPSPGGTNGTELKAVSCASATACEAVGYRNNSAGYSDTLAEFWNGTSWTKQSTPATGDDYPGLDAVSCTSASACTAVGSYFDVTDAQGPLVARWNGRTWAMQSSPNPMSEQLYGVSCTSASVCTAVGYNYNSAGTQVTLAQGWNGKTWTVQPTPNPGSSLSALAGVSCTSASACVAAGNYNHPGGAGRTLAERYE